jgi:hypothetical protein
MKKFPFTQIILQSRFLFFQSHRFNNDIIIPVSATGKRGTHPSNKPNNTALSCDLKKPFSLIKVFCISFPKALEDIKLVPRYSLWTVPATGT